MKPLDLPSLPKKQAEKKVWLNNIEYFKSKVNDVLSNKTLLEETKLDFITDKWLKEQHKPKPSELIEIYKSKIEEDYEKTEIEQKISDEKREKFENSSKDIINNAISQYKSINNEEEIKKYYNSWYIHGERAIIDKSAFTEDTDTHDLNYDSFLAGHISNKFQQGISETFFYTKSKSYLLKEEDIFPAIDRLKIDNEYLIVSFDQNIDWLKESLNIAGLKKDSYNGLELINFPISSYHLVGQSFFILKKMDLPNILHLKIEESEIRKYSLDNIYEKIHLFSSIIDLNDNREILEELKPSNPDKDLRKQVLINLSLVTEIRWKKNINNIMIKTFSKYRERGILDNLRDVNKI